MNVQNKTGDNHLSYFQELDGLRFFAVLGVIVGHYIPVMKGTFIAASGVNLFFVLSGFLIARILILSKIENEKLKLQHWFSIRQFYIRRSLRIFPIYYLTIFIAFLVNAFPMDEYFLWFLFYSSNILAASGVDLGFNFNHLWSLAVEEQFYLIFPLIVYFVPNKHLKKLFVGMILTGVISRYLTTFFVSGQNWAQYALMPCALDAFGLGAILAYFQIFHPNALFFLKSGKIFFLGAFLLFLFSIISALVWKGNTFYYLFFRFSFAILSLWLVGMASSGWISGIFKRILTYKYIILMGQISYGLYLYHKFVPALTYPVTFYLKGIFIFVNPVLITFLVNIFVTVFLSIISWRFIEKPINNLKKYFEYNRKLKVIKKENVEIVEISQ